MEGLNPSAAAVRGSRQRRNRNSSRNLIQSQLIWVRLRLVFPCAVCTCSPQNPKTPGDWSIFSHRKNAIFTSEFVFEKPSSAPWQVSPQTERAPLQFWQPDCLARQARLRSTRGRRGPILLQFRIHALQNNARPA